MSKTPEQISNLCVENDKLRELWRIRDAIVDAALKWDLPALKAECDKHRSAMHPEFSKPITTEICSCSDCLKTIPCEKNCESDPSVGLEPCQGCWERAQE